MRSLRALQLPTVGVGSASSSMLGLQPMPEYEAVALGPLLPGEKRFLGPTEHWLGRDWSTRVAEIDGVIYKIALEAEARDREDAVTLATQTFACLTDAFGEPAQQREDIPLWLWDASDGNAVLQLANVADDRRVMVFLTSASIRKHFPPKRSPSSRVPGDATGPTASDNRKIRPRSATLPRTARGKPLRLLGILAAIAAAYSHSVSFDIGLGFWFGVYTASYAALTWAIVGSVCLAAAYRLRSPKWSVVGAYAALGGLAILGGLVGHRFNILVGLALLAIGSACYREAP